MSAVLAALAEPRRREILRLVWDRERAAGDIAAHVPVSFGAVSQHLSRLHDAGLVDVRRDGRRRLYRARKQELGGLATWLEAQWRDSLGNLKRLAECEHEETKR